MTDAVGRSSQPNRVTALEYARPIRADFGPPGNHLRPLAVVAIIGCVLGTPTWIVASAGWRCSTGLQVLGMAAATAAPVLAIAQIVARDRRCDGLAKYDGLFLSAAALAAQAFWWLLFAVMHGASFALN